VKTAWRLLLVAVFVLSVGFNITTAALGLAWTVVASVVEAVTGVAEVGSVASKEKAAAKTANRLAKAESESLKLADELKTARHTAATMEGKAAGLGLRAERAEAGWGKAKTALKKAEGEIIRLTGLAKPIGPKKVMLEGAEVTVSEAVAKVSNRVKARTAKVASADIGATFGQSIPWIGVAVVVAATGYDLKTSCDTMKDMHALEMAFDPGLANDPSVDEVCGMKVPTKEEIWTAVKASPGMAWDGAVQALGNLPTAPSLEWPTMPDVDWTPWN